METGAYEVLRAENTVEYRNKEQQLPAPGGGPSGGLAVIETIYVYFHDDPYRFEECAVEIARMMDPKIISCDLTRARVDGGRDAVGTYQIGGPLGGVTVEFALEAKCYALTNAVGVREVARLISRLRHRQFAIFVTTSYIHSQAYKEIRSRRSPGRCLGGA